MLKKLKKNIEKYNEVEKPTDWIRYGKVEAYQDCYDMLSKVIEKMEADIEYMFSMQEKTKDKNYQNILSERIAQSKDNLKLLKGEE